MKKKLMLVLLLLLFPHSPTVFAWDPTPTDLSGTGSSTTNLGDEYDIDSTTAGIQIGEDAGSIAFLLKLPDYFMPGMTSGDQYEIIFTSASTDFALVFLASASKDAALTLHYKDTASSTWLTADTVSATNMKSNTPYGAEVSNLGFTVVSQSTIKVVVTKGRILELGATDTALTGIFGATFSAGSGTPENGGATPNDRCPSSGYASFGLTQGIDDFPHGTLVLSFPVMGLYLLFRKKKARANA